jgi:hypothetical protein
MKLGIGHYAAQSLLRVSPGYTSMYTRSAERNSASLEAPPSPATTLVRVGKRRDFCLSLAACGGGVHPCTHGARADHRG